MHSQNNEAGWRHFRKANLKSLPCMITVGRANPILKTDPIVLAMVMAS
jgi:hypothetical protein